MVDLKISKGLDIPIKGKPEGAMQSLESNRIPLIPKKLGLDLSPFEEVKFRLLCKAGDVVKIGQPLVEDKEVPERMFVSPAGGVISEIRRGLKRRLLCIVIDVAGAEEWHEFPPLDVSQASKQEIMTRMLQGGLFAHIRQRPFNLLANPHREPRCIFIKAIESSPFAVEAEMQVLGHEKEFQTGLSVLSKLTQGPVHLVYKAETTCKAFSEAQGVHKHRFSGPHPVGNSSVHIHFISPIKQADEVVWTLNVTDVIGIGSLMIKGRYFVERVISIGGPGVLPGRTGFYPARMGFPVEGMVSGSIEKGVMRFISGDVLTGQKVEIEDFLGFYHSAFCVFPENISREFLHFLGLGVDKYSASGTYFSGHLAGSEREYDFTTSLHGEPRPFVVSSPYDRVMPMRIPTMQLVKAVLAEDFELAEELGLLEVDSEDFALATFVCPSKMEMVDIIKKGLKDYSQQMLS